MKKLIYFIFLLPLFTFLNVNAQTYSLNATSYGTSASDYSSRISCTSTNSCSVTDIPFYNYPMNFAWGFNSPSTCSGSTTITGSLANDRPQFGITNSDFSYTQFWLATNGVDYPCAFNVTMDGTSFSCSSNNLGSTFSINYKMNNNFNTDLNINSIIAKNFNINCDNSTQQIIENNNFNTDRIIDNNLNGFQSITDNQNQNTQQQIESQKVCTTEVIDKSKITQSYSALTGSGQISSSNSLSITDYIYIKNATNFKNILPISTTANVYLCFFDDNYQTLSCLSKSSYNNNTNILVPNNATYVRFTLDSSNNRPQFTFDICKNGNQALSDSITDTTPPDTDYFISGLENQLPSDTPISDLILMPINLVGAFVTGINGSCSPVNLGNLYGTDLILPCIDLETRLGSNLWSTIDTIFCIFMCYNIGMLFITAWDGITGLRDDFSSLYQPKHADTGYQPKHGG